MTASDHTASEPDDYPIIPTVRRMFLTLLVDGRDLPSEFWAMTPTDAHRWSELRPDTIFRVDIPAGDRPDGDTSKMGRRACIATITLPHHSFWLDPDLITTKFFRVNQ